MGNPINHFSNFTEKIEENQLLSSPLFLWLNQHDN